VLAIVVVEASTSLLAKHSLLDVSAEQGARFQTRVASMNLLTFTIATVIGRTLHFAIVAVLVAFWGQQFLQLMARYERSLVGLGILTAIGLGIAYSMR
jgi:hypothetical protein